MRFSNLVVSLRQTTDHNGYRYCVVFESSDPKSHAENLSALKQASNSLDLQVISDNLSLYPDATSIRNCSRLLGTETDIAVIDGFNGVNGNALGIATGCVRAGGLLILLTKAGQSDRKSRFEARMVKCLNQSESVFHYSCERAPIRLPDSEGIEFSEYQRSVIEHQQTAVDAVCRVIEGQRKKPTVLIADRGRGKSSILGLAARQLAQTQSVQRILVTGRSRNSCDKVFEHACLDREVLEWISVETLLSKTPSCDLLLIDEAASIPVTYLSTLVSQYPRMALATTVNGYEGTGQGFTLRFRQILDRETRGWRETVLSHPIRWSAEDPLEKLTNRILIQNAEIPAAETVQEISATNCDIEQIAPELLTQNENLLRDLYSLLSLAHYKTSPTDLQQLLDNPQLRIYRLVHNQKTIGVALVVLEGKLSRETCVELFHGKRRPAGQVLPEIFAHQLGDPVAGMLSCARIMRIVIHPEHQKIGLGSFLLSKLTEDLSFRTDLIGSQFSSSPGLIRFWRNNGFRVIRIGQAKSIQAGGYSAVVIQSPNTTGQRQVEKAESDFSANFPLQLTHFSNRIEPALIEEIIRNNAAFQQPLSEEEQAAVISYALGSRTAESMPGVMLKFGMYALAHNLLESTEIWINRILLQRSWQESLTGGDGGWKEGNRILRAQTLKVLENHFNENLTCLRTSLQT